MARVLSSCARSLKAGVHAASFNPATGTQGKSKLPQSKGRELPPVERRRAQAAVTAPFRRLSRRSLRFTCKWSFLGDRERSISNFSECDMPPPPMGLESARGWLTRWRERRAQQPREPVPRSQGRDGGSSRGPAAQHPRFQCTASPARLLGRLARVLKKLLV